MNLRQIITLSVIVLFILALSAAPFIWTNESLDLNKFSQYGGFVSGLLGGITLILVVSTYTTTQKQLNVSFKQTFDSAYFTSLQVHQQIKDRLQQRGFKDIAVYGGENWWIFDSKEFDEKNIQTKESLEMRKRFEEKMSKIISNLDKSDFFETFYESFSAFYQRMLDINDIQKAEELEFRWRVDFLEEYYHIIGHYYRSFVNVMKFVDSNQTLTVVEKQYRINLLRDMTTFTELKIIFYISIWKHYFEKDDATKLFDKYDLFQRYGEYRLKLWTLDDFEYDWAQFKATLNS
jgi:branched-subunit amino acid transport protein AzlD